MEIPKFNAYRSHGDGGFRTEDIRTLGENVIFETDVLVFHPEHIRIGNNVYVGHRAILKGYYKNDMVIGDNVWIGQGCFFHSAGGIEIGRAVGIGPNVSILTSFHQDGDCRRPVMSNPLEFGKVVIGDGSDIGVGAIILPGVTIGEGVIVGAGAVVNKNIPDNCVVAGVPAKVIRSRV